jgi:hypothetical protein
MRVANRSALQTIAVTSPGWMLDGPAVNCTYTIENQVPATLECYHDAVTIFRVTPTAAGAFSLPLKLVTDDPFSPNRVTIDGTAVHVRKLTVLNGSEQISGTGARLTISQTWFATPKRIAFTLRNDDVIPLRFTCAIPAVNRVHCTAKTSGAPLSPLPVGATTTWEIEYTSSAMYWQFTPEITVLNDPGRVISFTVINDTGPTLYLGAAPYDGSASNGSSGGCGVGSVSSLLLLMALGGWLSLRPPRRD